MALLEALLAAGVDPARMMPGTGCCALTDSVRLTEHAVKAGCAGVLMLPPFYYKDVTDNGLYRHFAEVIERVGDARLRIYLYHIPPVAVVGITPTLVERLMKRYPSAVAGMKDSSGDWNNTKTMLDAFAASGFDVFPGSESFLLAGLRHGAVGCISATANVNPGAIDRLYREWHSADADRQQEALNDVRKTVGQYVMIPGLKQVIAHYAHDPAWVTVRPPLTELTAAQAQQVLAGLQQLGFTMPGLERVAA
jgi:4-hydroxy-tetrahydrodipicolinate synthase